ncbi:MAG: CaiB/BaiF CoA-transferase family protein [Acidimicrobiales bacterium]|jgi:crotonobetainyl-CoA:carnitine CoA-transferase CaiB-like acyl-CoA transferase|nr:CoA transferase [Acidimicrobiales bacterium]MDG1846215.1 CaiB/BaiF CoA-transferase family protein [Acidimicrobiales bacterium]
MAGPLDGIKVIDMSAVISGPMACQVLADQGADVIKIEPLGIGDITRIGGFRVGDISAMFATVNRGKRSVALDLSQEEGVSILKKMVETADVLVQNFRPGAVDRMGVGPDTMLEINPELIYVSISGFGADGPYSDWRVYDPIIQSISGVVSIQQSPEIPIPDLVRTIVCDKTTALTAATAISSALFARASGKSSGQHIEIPMLDAAIYWLWPDVFMGHTLWDDDVVPGALIYQIYRLQQTADGHLVYFSASDKEFAGLTKALEHPEWLEDPRFSSPAKRQESENFEALGGLLHDAFLKFTTDDIMERLRTEEVPAAQVNTVDEVFTDPQVINNEIIVEWEHSDAGLMKMAKPPVRWGTTKPDLTWSTDHVGQSTLEVLDEYGFDQEEISILKKKGIIPET